MSLLGDSSVPWFAPFLDRAMPSQSEVEQNFPVLTSTILPESISEGISRTNNKA